MGGWTVKTGSRLGCWWPGWGGGSCLQGADGFRSDHAKDPEGLGMSIHQQQLPEQGSGQGTHPSVTPQELYSYF